MIIIFHLSPYQPLLIFYSRLWFNEHEHSRAEGTITLNLNKLVSSQFKKSPFLLLFWYFRSNWTFPFQCQYTYCCTTGGQQQSLKDPINSIETYFKSPVMVVQNNRLLRCAVSCSACIMDPTLSQWIFCFPGGGFHHCSGDRGGGFCAYADITLAIKVRQMIQAVVTHREKPVGIQPEVLFD